MKYPKNNKPYMMKACVYALAAALVTSGTASALDDKAQEANLQQGELTVKIEVASTEGAVMLAVFGDAKSYEGGQPVTGRRVELTAMTTSITIGDLPYGQYAIKAFHDLDGDGKLTTNPFGAPVEPFAFSNGAKAHYGPPAFDAAAIMISSPNTNDTLSFVP